MKKFSLFLFFLVFLSGCAFPGRKNPDEILDTSVRNFFALDAFSVDSEFRILPDQALLSRESSFVFDGSFSSRAQDVAPVSTGTFSYATQLGSATTRIGGDFLRKDAVSYIRLSELPGLGFFDTTSFQNQWFKIDDDFSNVLQSFSRSQALVLFEAYSASSSETKQKIEDLLVRADIFSVEDVLPKDRIDDSKVYHYTASLDQDQTHALWLDGLAILADDPAAAAVLQDQNLSSSSLSSVSFDHFDFWVGTRDLLPRKISFTGSFSPATPTASPGSFEGVFSFKDFHQVPIVSVPENAQSFRDFLKQKIFP